jgi:hypothetical protein
VAESTSRRRRVERDGGRRPQPADIDGIATAGETPVTVAHYQDLTPEWVDGTAVGVPETARQGRPPGDRS